MEKIKVFCSYSHSDEEMRKELEKHLGFLKRDSIVLWSDRKILLGQEINEEIKNEINTADIILLLVSANFISSFYCYNIELIRAMERHAAKEAVVIPIILSDCVWKNEPFAKLLIAPNDAKPINNPKYWSTQDEAWTDVASNLSTVVENIKSTKAFKSDSASPVEPNVESQNTFKQAVELWFQQAPKLDYNTSTEDVKRILKLRNELLNQIAGEIEEKIKHIPSIKSKLPEVLFDKIYASEELDSITINDIRHIREDKETYKWYERKVIVSAIVLSLISARKFDRKKANILVDIITDFEDNVWQNALVGLVIALLHHKNKWGRFDDFKRRLETLREISKVQEGLNIVEYILRVQLYKKNFFNPKLFNLSFFESPINCFIPFYENNSILQAALDTNASDVDSDDFLDYITKLPFIDSYKYALCIAVEKGTAEKIVLTGKEKGVFQDILLTSSWLNPYQNIIAEYFNFFSFYPKSRIETLFNTQLSIAGTNLKSLILEKKNELLLTADLLMSEDRYLDAILRLNDLLKIDEYNYRAILSISFCYMSLKEPDFNKAISVLEKYQQNKGTTLKILTRLGDCYFLSDKNTMALEYFKKAEVQQPNNREAILGIAQSYHALKDYDNAIEYYLKGDKVYPDDYHFIFGLGCAYDDLNKPTIALNFLLKSENICEEDVDEDGYEKAELFSRIQGVYFDLFDYNNALKYAYMAYNIKPDDPGNSMSIGRCLLFNGDTQGARKQLMKSIDAKEVDVTYGNLGHYELITGDEDDALDYYVKCAVLMGNRDEFVKKYDKDLPHIIRHNIDEERYQLLRERVLERSAI